MRCFSQCNWVKASLVQLTVALPLSLFLSRSIPSGRSLHLLFHDMWCVVVGTDDGDDDDDGRWTLQPGRLCCCLLYMHYCNCNAFPWFWHPLSCCCCSWSVLVDDPRVLMDADADASSALVLNHESQSYATLMCECDKVTTCVCRYAYATVCVCARMCLIWIEFARNESLA